MTNDKSSSLKEAKLRNEIMRIRNTYSFNLGLLLTDSLFRKPWKILILPFTFISMNLRFFTSKKRVNNLSNNLGLGSYNSNCLLIFVASEGGKAACERVKEIANEWLKTTNNRLVIVSSNTGLIGFNQINLSLYMLPDPKSKENVSRSQWNNSCENTIYSAIYTHLPSKFIFDGPYPYRGVLNAIDSAPGMKSIWVQSERTNLEIIEKAKSHFTEMKEINYLDISPLQQKQSKRNYNSLTNRILLATEYGYREENQKLPELVLKILSNYQDIELIGIKNIYNSKNHSTFSTLWDEVIDNPELEQLQGAIVSDNIELITKLHSLLVPTLCILHKNTTPEVKSLINKLSSSGTLFVSKWNEKEEIELYINALNNREWNLSISQRWTASQKPNLNNFLYS